MGDAGFEAAAVTYDEMTAEYGRMTAQDAFSC
jgi:hypothetical protein